MKRVLIYTTACLALAGCGENSAPDTTQDDDATARGEVLGGTISDDMLPLDTLRSQSPPLQINGDQGANSNGNEQGAAEAEDAQEAGASEDEISDEAAPETAVD